LGFFDLRFAAQKFFDARRRKYGFGFWFGRTVVFSAGSFIPTSLATVARTGFYKRGQQPGSGFYSGGGCFSMGIPCPAFLANVV
jgi:hypothetical protein